MKTRRKIFLACALVLFFAYIVHRGAERGSDFKYPYNPARALWKTGRLHIWAQPRYPITLHVLLAPLASLPLGYAAAVWAALSFTAVAALPRTLEALTGIPPRRQLGAWLLVLPALLDALVLGQSDPINLLLVAAGLLAVGRGRPVAGVGLIGVAGMIKVLPILHWLTILSRRRDGRVWAAMALTIALGFGGISAAVGWGQAVAGIREQYTWIRDHEKPWHFVARQSDLRANNESLPIVLARTFGDVGSPPPAHAPALDLVPLSAVWWAWGAILAVLALAWLASARASEALPPRRAWLGMFALTSIVMLASTPICWHHYFVWLLPAALFLAERRRLLGVATAVSLAGTCIPAARGVGLHMMLALALFAVVVREIRLLARNLPTDPTAGAGSVIVSGGDAGPSPADTFEAVEWTRSTPSST